MFGSFPKWNLLCRRVSHLDYIVIYILILCRFPAQIYETFSPLNGQVNHNTLAFVRRANIALDKWWADCDEFHRKFMFFFPAWQ